MTNNIFGVDIDYQAVEVTKLNLLLKAMEGETKSSINQQLLLFHERVLPNLDNNIKCGNSLIGTDFYDQQVDILPEQIKKVNAFNWNDEFKEIFSNGGFDCVIGNPPWGAHLSEAELKYLREKHEQIIVRMIDTFMFFVHKGSQNLSTYGYLGFVLPDVILYQTDNRKLREYLLKSFRFRNIINCGDVFEGVKRPSCIVVFDNEKYIKNKISIADVSKFKKSEKSNAIKNTNNFSSIEQKAILEIENIPLITSNFGHYSILSKLKLMENKPLAYFVDNDGIQRGVSPDLKEAFIVDMKTIKKYKLEQEKIKPVLTGGKEVKRYYITNKESYLIYTSRNDDFSKIPNICNFIDQFINKITCKEVKQKKHPLHALHRPRKESIFTKSQKIVGVITEDEIVLCIDEKQIYTTDGLYVFGVKEDVDIEYIMGVLNSKLFVFLYRLITMEKGRMLAQVKPTVLNTLPIRLIDYTNLTEKNTYDKIVNFVGNILKLKKELQLTKLESQRQQIERIIQHTKNNIDEKVYELYGLDNEEIALIENGK